MNSKRKGSFAVGEAVQYFTGKNQSVFIPISDCDKYDLVIDEKGVFRKVQCKYSGDKAPSGGFIVDLRTFGGYREKTYHTKYLKDDFDYLFISCSNGEKFIIPAKAILHKSQIVVGGKNWKEYKI